MSRVLLVLIASMLLLTPTITANANTTDTRVEYKTVNGINFVKLLVLLDRYGYTAEYSETKEFIVVKKGNNSITTAAGVSDTTVSIPLQGNVFYIDQTVYNAQSSLIDIEGDVSISVKDFANLFGFAASFYKDVQRLEKTERVGSSQTAVFDHGTYFVSPDWGDKLPKGVSRYGVINITETIPILSTYSF